MTCDGCGKKISGRPHTSVTGRRLCTSCDDGLLGAAAGMVAGGGDVGTAVATGGWYQRLRERRRTSRRKN